MDHLRFAICIVLPGAGSSDIVKAAIKYNVHIIDKEPLDPTKDYNYFPHAETLENGARIFPLFVSLEGSVLVDDEVSGTEALESLTRLKEILAQV